MLEIFALAAGLIVQSMTDFAWLTSAFNLAWDFSVSQMLWWLNPSEWMTTVSGYVSWVVAYVFSWLPAAAVEYILWFVTIVESSVWTHAMFIVAYFAGILCPVPIIVLCFFVNLAAWPTFVLIKIIMILKGSVLVAGTGSPTPG